MSRQMTYPFVFLIALLLLVLLSGCSGDDCPTCPEQPELEGEYYFVYLLGLNNRTYTFSSLTGNLVDSVQYGGSYPFYDLKFSKEGERAFYCSDAVWVTDFESGDTLAYSPELTGRYLSVSADDDYLLITGNGTKVVLAKSTTLEVVYERSHPFNSWSKGAIHPTRNMACVGNNALDSLLVIDFESVPPRDTMIPLFTASGLPVPTVAATFTVDGSMLMLVAPPGLQCRDADSFALVREFETRGRIPYPHPDGKRVLFLQWRDEAFLIPAEIWELNLESLVMRQVLSELDVRFPSPFDRGFDPTDLDFTPDGRFAFIANGGSGLEWGPIIKFNCDSYEIQRLITPPLGLSRLIRMNPKKIS